MKWYRLIDQWGEPYATSYNDTDLKDVAYGIWSLGDGDGAWDDEEFYGKTDEEAVNKIYSLLEKGERDLLYIVEESDEPFESEGEYGGDECGHNYSKEDILKYVGTRNDLGEYDEDKLLDYVWSFSTHNGLTSRHLSEIIDQFSNENWKDDLFDDLNNMLFNKHSELVKAISDWCNKHSIRIDDVEIGNIASDFVDWKELYDLDYED